MNTIQQDKSTDNNKPKEVEIVKGTLFKEYRKLMAQYDLLKLSEYKGIIEVQVETIPLEKTHFLNSSDEWQRLSLPPELNTTACIYYGKKGNSFPVHKHVHREETIVLLQGGSFEYIMDNGNRGILNVGESVVFPKTVGHYLKWIEDCVVLIFWSPEFYNNSWSGKFTEE